MTEKDKEDALVKRTIGSSTGRIAQRDGNLYEEVYAHEYTLTWSGQLRSTKKGWKLIAQLPEDADSLEDI